MPRFPDGYPEPEARPLHPQRHAERMAGRRATGPHAAEIPRSLRGVVIGDATAREIGWQ